MRLSELTVAVDAEAADAAVAAVMALGVQGVALRDADTGEPPGRSAVVAWLPASVDRAAVERRLAAALPGATVAWRSTRPTWHGEEGPVPIGRGFVVVAPGDEPGGRRTPLRLDGELAFGDGRHPTTVLCVEALERAFRQRPVRSVLDVGTGTGILALVAARLGAARVVATDIDPLAREAARAHVAGMGLLDRVTIAETPPEERFDVVVANLYLEPLVALAPMLADRTGGTLYVSGVILTSRGEARAAFRGAGLRLAGLHRRGAWAGLRFERACG